ncbi:MAG: glycoside hydrolase family 9 protein [Lachnospiraceae bacterium]|nr:glycoside hydrolase family 9 protein [Lachnospiraceae bacterium]
MSIFTDQCGYFPNAEKRVRITEDCKEFYLVAEDGRECFRGPAVFKGLDAESGDNVWIGDFSSFKEGGIYRIGTDQDADSLSYPFVISEAVYDDALKKLLKAFYFLRCGTELSDPWAEGFTHKACHLTPAMDWFDHSYSKDVRGGWHDAGDYGRYVTAGACAVAHLLYAYQLYPEVFNDLKPGIPEDEGQLPSILAECAVELRWLLKMQREDGAVWHKVTTAHHAPFVMPEEDQADLFLFAPSTMATADAAAVWALAYRIYKPFDPAFAAEMLDAAMNSYEFLNRHPEMIGFNNPPGNGTGGYGEFSDRDNRYWAAAELYCTTGEEWFRQDFIRIYKDGTLFEEHPLMKKWGIPPQSRAKRLTELGYGAVAGFGSFSYLMNDKPAMPVEEGETLNRDPEVLKELTEAFREAAEDLVTRANESGYGIGMKEGDYCWGSNMVLMKQGMLLAMAEAVTAQCSKETSHDAEGQQSASEDYFPIITHYANYLFGENALGISYVSGVGENCICHPHLRPAEADGIEECIPGMVSGGPNKRPCENDRNYVSFDAEQTPPMKCFEDLVECFSLNEITIYWNSPAVFVLAALMDHYKR